MVEVPPKKGHRKLVVSTFVTADGVMQSPGGPDEDREGGFQHGGWPANYWDDAMGKVMDELLARLDALLLGRKTYEIFAAHWPRVKNDPAADKLNSVLKYVGSRTLRKVEWNNSKLLQGDVGEAVAKLKREPGGEIQVHGSGNLVQTLLKNDFVDEFRIWTFPVVLGTGKRLFGEGTRPVGLRLLESTVSSTGVVMQRYERSGEIRYGSFALD